MKLAKYFLPLIGLLGVFGLCSLTLKDPDLELVWHDEFDVDGSPSKDNWQFEKGFCRNEELQWYNEKNAYVKNGILTIEGRKETFPNPWYDKKSKYWTSSRKEVHYTSSSINTSKSFNFQYGRVEIRARIPVVMGAWPAIWTLGKNGEWPSCGEIDIMECYHRKGVPYIMANAAYGSSKRYDAVWKSKATPYSDFQKKDPYWNQKFHIWRMDWTKAYIRLYLDDELLNEVDLTKTKNGSYGKYRNPFHEPHYLLLNLAIGGYNGGTPIADSFPLKYEIDYVRIYKFK